MKLIIDIPEEFYTVCKEWVADYCANIEQAIIAEGTPLPQGEWIYHTDGYVAFYTCDKCGSAGDIQDKFCRNCGANMRGENNG